MLTATFNVLESGPLVDLRNVTFPHLASLLRHGTPIPIHGGQGTLCTVNIGERSRLAGQTVAEAFERFPELLAVAIIRDQQVQLPRGSSELVGGDQLLVVASESGSVDNFRQAAAGEKQK
jgi:Trk K+ transport system NAD-binding subunit